MSSQLTVGDDAPSRFGAPGGPGGDGPPGGVLVVQSPVIHNTGSLIARDGDDGRPGGGGDDGQIFWVSTCALSGTVQPTPTKVTP